MGAFLGVGLVVVTARQIRAGGTLLRVDARGISLSTRQRNGPPVHVPWASVRAVVVVMGPDSAPQVGVRLHHGAPLPTGVRGLVHDPSALDRVQPALVRQVPRLDRAALATAVEPHGVPVVTSHRM